MSYDSKTAWHDYAAERDDALRAARKEYTERQLKHGENVPSAAELDAEDRAREQGLR